MRTIVPLARDPRDPDLEGMSKEGERPADGPAFPHRTGSLQTGSPRSYGDRNDPTETVP
jgi:hypothetical protein